MTENLIEVKHNSDLNWIVFVKNEEVKPFMDVKNAELYANELAEMGKSCMIFQKVFTISKKIVREVTMPTDRNFQVFLSNEKELKKTK